MATGQIDHDVRALSAFHTRINMPDNSELLPDTTFPRQWRNLSLRVTTLSSTGSRKQVRGWLYQANEDHILLSPNRAHPDRTIRLEIERIKSIHYPQRNAILHGAAIGTALGGVLYAVNYQPEHCVAHGVGFFGWPVCTRVEQNPKSKVAYTLEGMVLGTMLGAIQAWIMPRVFRKRMYIFGDVKRYKRKRLQKLAYRN